MDRKRKRAALEEDGGENQEQQRALLRKKLFHGRKLLQRSLKQAKGFERQKLGKRLKMARSADRGEGISKIENEIDLLKSLDLWEMNDTHVKKCLLKDPSLRTSSLLLELLGDKIQQPPDNVSSQIAARICNSNTVKDTIQDIVKSVKSVLFSDGARGIAWSGRLANRKVKRPREAPDTASTQPGNEIEEEEDGRSSEQATDTQVGEVQLADQAQELLSHDLDEKIAVSSEQDYSAGSEEDIAQSRTDFPERQIDFLSSESPSASPYPQQEKQSDERPSKSAFIPSLTMGGYVSGSDSDAEREFREQEVAPRKNRRGQRARREIWEKKYGRQARHLQQNNNRRQAGEKDGADGWNPRRGAQFDNFGSRKGAFQPRWKHERSAVRAKGDLERGQGGPAFNARSRDAKPSDSFQGRRTGSEKASHPSWEAARKAKEQKQTASFTGKKTTFD